MSIFSNAYDALNAEQKKAVDAIEGPVLVLAGPGTGKTQVVALRVATILKRTQARPSNILCLTFSLSGAAAMRSRLRSMIGADAYGVTVTTIHGFCNDIIQSHPETFAAWRLVEQVTDIEQCHLLNAIIDDVHPGAVIVSARDPHGRTPDILRRISQCKREAVSVEDVVRVAAAYRTEMEGKSKPGTKAHERNVRLALQCEEFAELYALYDATLKQRGLYDYDDMIHTVIRALRQEDWLLASLQERYQYILVDEYQDLNRSQSMVLTLLTSTPESTGDPNICIVGDDDQAIYRFQGANVSGMVEFLRRFPAAPIISLQTSYRSTQAILDAAERLIAKNEQRLTQLVPGVEKRLVSAAGVGGMEPVLLRPASDAVEPFVIAQQVRALLDHGVHPSDIAVLVRTNGELFELFDVFRGLRIPAQMTGKLNLLRHPKVLQVVALLCAIGDVQDDAALVGALACPCFGLHPADLARISLLQREENVARKQSGQPYRRISDMLLALDEYVATGLTLHDGVKLAAAFQLLLGHSQRLRSVSVPEIVEAVLKESGLLPTDPRAGDPIDVIALSELFDHIKRRCYELSGYGLPSLLRDFRYRQEYGLPLQYAVPHITDTGVQLMTAHASKGLEFAVVFLTQFRERHWDRRRAPGGLSLPDHLLFNTDGEEGIEDERRLAYVAWTRAKGELVLSCPLRIVRGDREQEVSPSGFIADAAPIEERDIELQDPALASILLLPLPVIDGALEAFLRFRLETFELSVTALNHFLQDPQSFLLEDLLALPRAKTSTQAYGTAVHEALLQWGRAMKEGADATKERFIGSFRREMAEREIMTDAERRRLVHLGERALDVYYDARLVGQPIVWHVEKKITARIQDVPVKGLIDRIDLIAPDEPFLRIIDYKTGKPKTEKEAREEHNGNLYRQLVFYKLLIAHAPQMMGITPTEFILDFIGEGQHEPSTLFFAIPDADAKALATLIRTVWDKILALDFTPITFA